MPPVSTSRGDRLAYLDWLRFLVVLSLAPFHAAISFTGMGSVYVYDTPVRDILLAGSHACRLGPRAPHHFTVFMDNWFIHLLFLMSGIGAALSLRKRSGAQFLGERCNRLLLRSFSVRCLWCPSNHGCERYLSAGFPAASSPFFLRFSTGYTRDRKAAGTTTGGISGSLNIFLSSRRWRCRCSFPSSEREKRLASFPLHAVLLRCR